MNVDLVPIRVGENWLFIRAELVCEFLSSTPWLSVPGSTQLIPGVMTWRGRAIPVLDLPQALHIGAITPLEERSRVMVIEHAKGAVAVPVDGAREVTIYTEEFIRPQHVSTMPYAAGEIDVAGTVVPVVELDQLLNDIGRASA